MSIVTDIRLLLGNSSLFWSDQHVYDAANEAQLEAYGRGKWAIGTNTLSVNTGDDLVYMHSSTMIPLYVEYLNKHYFITTQARLEQFSRSWKGASLGPPKWFVLFDFERLRVWPRPDDQYNMTLWHVPWPTEISASVTDITGVDRSYTNAIVNWAGSNLFRFTRPDLSEALRREGDEWYMKFKRTLRNQQSHNIQRMRPGGLFQKALGGNIDMGRAIR